MFKPVLSAFVGKKGTIVPSIVVNWLAPPEEEIQAPNTRLISRGKFKWLLDIHAHAFQQLLKV